ncbi:hypothetical protein D3C71_1795840 [compost metagenome]
MPIKAAFAFSNASGDSRGAPVTIATTASTEGVRSFEIFANASEARTKPCKSTRISASAIVHVTVFLY